MKVLVTGGAGFIGSHLVDKLLSEDHEVFVVDDLSGGTTDNLAKEANLYTCDCRDEKKMDFVFETVRPEICFHLAANAAENKAQFSPIDVTSRNYDAFIKTLTPFIKYGGKRFVFTSSIAVYGALQTPFKETAKAEPEDLYGITKLAAEETLKVLSKVHDFEYVIARPHNVYGERQNMKDPYRNVVTIWMNAILRNEPVYIYGEGRQKRQFTYIADLIWQLYQCGFNPAAKNQTFNLGDEAPAMLLDLLLNMSAAIEKNIVPEYLPMRPQEVMEALSDHSLAKYYLGDFEPTGLIEGLRRTWMWCKKQGAQIPKFDTLEIPNEKVPKNWL